MLPKTINVTGASYSWDSLYGVLEIYDPVSDIEITIDTVPSSVDVYKLEFSGRGCRITSGY
jgi:hypothetical protein